MNISHTLIQHVMLGFFCSNNLTGSNCDTEFHIESDFLKTAASGLGVKFGTGFRYKYQGNFLFENDAVYKQVLTDNFDLASEVFDCTMKLFAPELGVYSPEKCVFGRDFLEVEGVEYRGDLRKWKKCLKMTIFNVEMTIFNVEMT